MGLYACKKEKIEVEEECTEPLKEQVDEKILKIEFGHPGYHNLNITVNDVETDKTTFPVESGDKVDVVLSNYCYTYTYFGLGDTVGIELTECEGNGITLWVNDSIVDGCWCMDDCDPTEEVHYIVY